MTIDMDEQNGLHYPNRAVVDTCVLLNIALGDCDNQPDGRLSRSNGLINDALAGKLELLLPSTVLIELSTDHVLRSGTNPREHEFRMKKHRVMEWCRNSELEMVDLTSKAAEWYNENSCVQDIRFGDAAILCSAKYCDAQVIYTWDVDFMRRVNQANVGVTAKEPPQRPITLSLS